MAKRPASPFKKAMEKTKFRSIPAKKAEGAFEMHEQGFPKSAVKFDRPKMSRRRKG